MPPVITYTFIHIELTYIEISIDATNQDKAYNLLSKHVQDITKYIIKKQ